MSNLAVSATTTPYVGVTSTTGSSSSTTVSNTSSATVKTVTASTTPSSSTTAKQSVNVATSSNTATLSSSTTYAYGSGASNSTSKMVSSTTVYATSSSTTPSYGTLERNNGTITILTSSSTTPNITSSSATPSVTSSNTPQINSSSTTLETNSSIIDTPYTTLIEGIDNQIRALAHDSTLKYTDPDSAKEKLAELQAMRQQIYNEASMRNNISAGVSESIEYEEFSFTREEEKAFDLMVQENIMEFISQEKYSYNAWNNYTREEKEKCLTEIYNHACSQLGIVIDGIEFNGQSQALGAYDSNSNKIVIKENCLSDAVDYGMGVIKTLLHEIRHAYQNAVIDNPNLYVVSKETREVWADNYINYIVGSENPEYRAQPVEWDAANFAKQVVNINKAKETEITYEGSWENE